MSNLSQPGQMHGIPDPSGVTIHWDRRNGPDTYPYPHNDTHGWQQCPSCLGVVRTLEIACDYYPRIVRCECGKTVRCPGITDDGRFSGLHAITRAAEGLPPILLGEVPVNASESVRDEFAMMAADRDYYEED